MTSKGGLVERTNIMSGDMYSLYSRRGFLQHKRDITLLWFEFYSGRSSGRPQGPPWRTFLDHARGTTHLWLADHRARTGLTMSSISPSVSRGRLRPSLTTRFDPAMRAIAHRCCSACGCGPRVSLALYVAFWLALYVAFWLEFDDPFWAGTSAPLSTRHNPARRCAKAGSG